MGRSTAVVGVEDRRAAGGRLGELYGRHADDALRLAFLPTGNREVAEDLVQDAFVKLAGRLSHLRNPEAFPGYLRTTIVNLARMQFRRKRVEQAYLSRESFYQAEEPPQRDVAEMEAIRGALMRLPLRQRAAVVLRFFEDLSDSQTAQILGCAPGTVRSLVSRAMETLRQEVSR